MAYLFRNPDAHDTLNLVSNQKSSTEQRFGTQLRDLRAAADMTQRELAAQMTDRGFSWLQSTVTKTEAGERPLRLDEFVAICEILGQQPGMTLTILGGPEIKREAQLAGLRARVIAAQREAREAQDRAALKDLELHELAQQLERLEADAS